MTMPKAARAGLRLDRAAAEHRYSRHRWSIPGTWRKQRPPPAYLCLPRHEARARNGEVSRSMPIDGGRRESGMNAPEIITILGKGSAFDGKLTFEGTVRIDGDFSG